MDDAEDKLRSFHSFSSHAQSPLNGKTSRNNSGKIGNGKDKDIVDTDNSGEDEFDFEYNQKDATDTPMPGVVGSANAGSSAPLISQSRASTASTMVDSVYNDFPSGRLRPRASSDSTSRSDYDMVDAYNPLMSSNPLHQPPNMLGSAARNSTTNRGRRSRRQQRSKPAPMKISLDGLKSAIDPAKMFERDPAGAGVSSCRSVPATSTFEHACCPTCGRALSEGFALTSIGITDFGGVTGDSGENSPNVVPPGPLLTAAMESGITAVDELKLLKTQVQDVSRVCQAVARGDLTQKITVPVQGVVMIQLKDVINTMVRPNSPHIILNLIY